MNKYEKYTVDDFVTHSDFIAWVVKPSVEKDNFWAEVIKRNPEQKEKIKRAAYIVSSIKSDESEFSNERIDLLWKRIEGSQKKANNSRHLLFRWAAVVILTLGLGGVTAYHLMTKQPKFEYTEVDYSEVEEAQVILADGTSTIISSDESAIELKESGAILVNNDTIQPQETQHDKMNHVIMPYGKQSSLTLPDGSVVFINAGSKVSFPSRFSKSKREVYLVGEAYFKIEPDKTKPFIVHSPDMDVEVTGTEFNVSAYGDDQFTQTVLVSGSVEVSKKGLLSAKHKIAPGQSMLFHKGSGVLEKLDVDISEHVSWINSYLMCKNMAVRDVVKKIERYYNQKIEIGNNIGNITFSGKLDLDENIMEVLEALAFASSLEIEESDNLIKLINK